MAFQLDRDESMSRGLRRLARKEVRAAANALESPGNDRNEAVHKARRSVKKARAVFKVFAERSRSDIRPERKRLRKVSRRLAPFRDADASVEMLDHLRKRAPAALTEHTFGLLRRALLEDRERLLRDDAGLRSCARRLRKTNRFIKSWRPKLKFLDFGLALEAARRSGRFAMARARASNRAEDFHGWRIAAKTFYNELRILEAAGGAIADDVRAFRELETWLGEDHNVVVFCNRVFGDEALQRSTGDLGKLRAAADDYHKELREESLKAGDKLYALDDAQYLARVQRQWLAWDRQTTPVVRAA